MMCKRESYKNEATARSRRKRICGLEMCCACYLSVCLASTGNSTPRHPHAGSKQVRRLHLFLLFVSCVPCKYLSTAEINLSDDADVQSV